MDLRSARRLLGVGPGASVADITAAFRSRAKELHPDKNAAPDATQRFQSLTAAKELLAEAAAEWERAEAAARATQEAVAEQARRAAEARAEASRWVDQVSAAFGSPSRSPERVRPTAEQRKAERKQRFDAFEARQEATRAEAARQESARREAEAREEARKAEEARDARLAEEARQRDDAAKREAAEAEAADQRRARRRESAWVRAGIQAQQRAERAAGAAPPSTEPTQPRGSLKDRMNFGRVFARARVHALRELDEALAAGQRGSSAR